MTIDSRLPTQLDNAAPGTLAGGYDRLYRSGGFGYELKRRRWKRWVRKHYIKEFGLRRGQTLLDIPCGDGFWTGLFAELGFRVTGVDLSPGGIEVARRRHPTLQFVVGDAELPLPVGDRSFDVVFSRAISHLHRTKLRTARSEQMVRNLMRHVRPGGLLLVSYYTTRDGSVTSSGRRANHPLSDLAELYEVAGDVFRAVTVGDHVQLGVQHRHAPCVWAGGRRRTPTIQDALDVLAIIARGFSGRQRNKLASRTPKD